MCGRYNIIPDAKAWADVAQVLGEILANELKELPTRYNVAPTQNVPIIVTGPHGGEQVIQARWGFVPSWWKRPLPPKLTTNVRSETAASKPMWREAWTRQRCLIPATSWYEWFNADAGLSKMPKIPHVLERADGKQIFFAGLWSWYQASPNDEPMATCAIVTVASAPDIAEIHERTPVVLDSVHWCAWLDPQQRDPVAVKAIVDVGAVEHFRMHTVDSTVSNARKTGPECLAPRDWPEMSAQGRVRYTKAQLLWLRTAPLEEVRYELTVKLDIPERLWPPLAERRLWVRELMDRDDADQLAELIQWIRDTLKAKTQKNAKPEKPIKPDNGQGGLF